MGEVNVKWGVEDSYGFGWVDVVYAREYFFPPSGPRLRLPSLCRVWFFVRALLQLCRMLLLAVFLLVRRDWVVP